MAMIPFGAFEPDNDVLNAGVTTVENVLPTATGYGPFPQLQALAAAIGATPVGAIVAEASDGSIFIFAGTATKLWIYDSANDEWDDVSKAATTYGATVLERWRFAQFGDFVIAVNANNDPQVFEMGVSTTFDDLGGSPPRARHIAVWGDFLVLGGLVDYPNRVHWSALNNITGWTAGTNNSDYQDFPDGGPVQGMTSANNPIILQQDAIRRAMFVPGSREVFTFDKLHDKRGTKARYSLAFRGDSVFYLDEDGFYQIDYAGGIKPIGTERVNKWFLRNAVTSTIATVLGEVDPVHSRVYWALKTADDAEIYDVLLVYDWLLDRWAPARVNVKFLLPASAPGYTLEALDDISASLDALPFSLDSRVWSSGAPVLAAFDANNRLAFFSGANAGATLTTAEVGDTTGTVSRITSVMPVIDTSEALASLGGRMRRGDALVWSAERAQSTKTGLVRGISRARYHRIRVRLPAGAEWTAAQGVDVTTATAGSQ